MTVLDGYSAGDTAHLFLRVVPDGGVPTDPTTTATVVLHAPDGTARAPAAVPVGVGRDEWRAVVDDLLPGDYVGQWTVTGTGAGTQPVTILVGPGVDLGGGSSYATTGDLVAHTGKAPPPDARRLLVRASERVDELLRTAVYDVDDAGTPLDPGVAAALAEATCAQAAWFADLGDDGTGTVQHYGDVKIGTVQLSTRGAPGGEGGGGRYAPGVVTALRKVPGLYGAAPQVAW